MKPCILFFVAFVFPGAEVQAQAVYKLVDCKNGTIDIREDTGTSINCTGLNTSHNMYWSIMDNDGRDGLRIGECYTNITCKVLTDWEYNLTRTNIMSSLTIRGNYRNKIGKRIKCTQMNNNTRDSCALTVSYPGKPSNCSLTTNTDDWTVHGSCRVEKIFSSVDSYNCFWRQRGLSGSKNDIEIRGQFPSANFTDEEGNVYLRGNCSFSHSLPGNDGNYSYDVRVEPVYPDTVEDVGTVLIDTPDYPEISCTRFAVENKKFSCQCKTSSKRPGKPTPLLSWPGFSNTGNLELSSVPRGYNGKIFTCRLSWGPDHRIEKTANYTLQVAYGPDSANISLESEPETNRTRLTCRVHDVHPAANFTWTGIDCDARNDTRDESVCFFSKTVENAGKDVTCTAVNVIDRSLAVKATFHDSDLDTNEPVTGIPMAVIAGSVGAAVVVVVVVVITVVIIIMSKRRKGAGDKRQVLNQQEETEAETNFWANNPGAVFYYNAGLNDRNLQSPSGVAKGQHGQTDDGYAVVEETTPVGSYDEDPARDVYVVVDKTKQHHQTTNNNSTAPQPASTHNVSPAKPGCNQGETTARSSDVYAYVNKSPKQDGPGSPSSERSAQDKQEAGEESVQSKMATQKTKPAVSSKPVAKSSEANIAGDVVSAHGSKPKPSARVVRVAYENVCMSSELPSLTQPEVTQTANVDDEYNTLRFAEKQSETHEDPSSDYSHLGSF